MGNNLKLSFTYSLELEEVLGEEFEVLSSDALGALPSQDRIMVLWEDPIRMIFRKIKEPIPISSEDLLQQWMESAKQILKAARRHRSQTTLIHLEEAQAAPAAFERYCAEQLGLEMQLPSAVQLELANVTLVFQKISQQSFRELLPLLQELEASSVTLDSSFDSSYSALGLSPEAVYSAIDQLKRAELDSIPREELVAAMYKVEALQGELEKKKKLLTQREDELKQSEETALEKYELLLTELHEAFKESEGYFEQWKKAESERDDSLDGANKEVEELRKQLGELSHELAGKETLLQQKDEELKQSEEKALQNYEMLLAELHEAFKESEGYFEQWKKAESAGRGLLLKVDSVNRGAVVDHGTHRHLDYTLSGVDLLGRSWPTLRVRLIRHNGRPGILLFEAGTAPLYAWEPSAQEGGVNFMLVVPSDALARDFLIRATTSDLMQIRDCATTILADLKMNGSPEGTPTDWISVGETLLQQFEEIPERLHYDSVRSRIDGEKARSLEFDIANASFKGRFYPAIRLSWETDSGKVTIFPDECGRPIFSGWPIDEQGRNRATCELFREASPLKKSPKTPLSEHDKKFLSVLLGEIPNFLVHAGSQHPKEAGRLKSLTGKAKGLHQKARKLKAL
jgi:hypothetical protein